MKRYYQWVVIFLYLMSTPLLVVAQQGENFYGPHMMWNGWHGMLFAPIFMIIFIALVVVGVVFLVRWLGGDSHKIGSRTLDKRDPLDILKERFANGEIDKDEFSERRQLLQEK